MELRFGDKMLEVKSLTIPPKQTVPQVFVASQEQDGVFSVHITAVDDLAADNSASIVSLLPKPVKVLLVTTGNLYPLSRHNIPGQGEFAVFVNDPFLTIYIKGGWVKYYAETILPGLKSAGNIGRVQRLVGTGDDVNF